MASLNENHRAILKVLARVKPTECAPTSYEIGLACGHRARYWAKPKLATLRDKGFVQVLGVAFDNSRTWQITPAGREALSTPLSCLALGGSKE